MNFTNKNNDEKKKEAKERQEEAEGALEDLFRTVDGGSLAPSSKALRKQKKENADDGEEKDEKEEKPLTLESIDPYSDDFEELMDKLRETLSERTDLTPCSKENFAKWYAAWSSERELERQKKAKRKLQKLGKKGLTGRELFSIDPNAFQDDEEAETQYIFEKEELEQQQQEQSLQQQPTLDRINEEENNLNNSDHKTNEESSPNLETNGLNNPPNESITTNPETQPNNTVVKEQVAVDESLFLSEIN